MNRLLLSAYHHMPPVARSVFATAQGYRLRWWRHGPDFERHTAAALSRDHWSREEWDAWQSERLGRLLQHAARHVPYYRQMWDKRRRQGDRAAVSYLENWPVLEKEAVRQAPTAFLAEANRTGQLLELHTSGTTGKPLKVWQSRATLTEWYALIEARRLRWYGVDYRARWALIGGQLVTPVTQRKPPFWVWNAALKQLYMSSYHLSDSLIPAYLDALRRYEVRYLWGYSSSLYALARVARDLQREDLAMRVSLSSAEPLYDHQRAAIRAVFGPVCETYGMTEIIAAASDCPHGILHLWPDAGYVELLDGELVATGLINFDMPLIRFRTGDTVAEPGIVWADSRCACGRTLPVMGRLEGRIDDLLVTRDGRTIGRLDPVFKSDLPIREAQIIQEQIDRVRVRFVPDGDHYADAMEEVVTALQARLGDVKVVLEPVSEIARGPNGKFKAVVNRIDPSARIVQPAHRTVEP